MLNLKSLASPDPKIGRSNDPRFAKHGTGSFEFRPIGNVTFGRVRTNSCSLSIVTASVLYRFRYTSTYSSKKQILYSSPFGALVVAHPIGRPSTFYGKKTTDLSLQWGDECDDWFSHFDILRQNCGPELYQNSLTFFYFLIKHVVNVCYSFLLLNDFLNF